MVIGLTGAIGAGKSTVAQYFALAGYNVADCDAVSRGINGDEQYVAAVKKAFGRDAVTLSDGKEYVDRQALARIVFSESGARKKLESISHPMILERVRESINSAAKLGMDTVVDAPLLFESGFDAECDVTVGVVAEEDVRIGRAVLRGGISRESIIARIAVQPKTEFYREKCDIIIENNGSEAELKEKFEQTLALLAERRGI